MKGKILFKGKIETVSPLHIGCGSDDRSDLDVLLDSYGQPFIPATSVVGVLKHYIDPYISDSDREKYKEAIKNFWGYSEKTDGHQSLMRCSDFICQTINSAIVIRDGICQTINSAIVIRDGIKIDNKTGIVKDEAKYDYELVERKTVFEFKMEFSFNDSEEELVNKMVSTIYFLLKDGKLQIGAKTNSGFGSIKLIDNETNIYLFDFSKPEHVVTWLCQNTKDFPKIPQLEKQFELRHKQFTIDATFKLKNSMIIRSYSTDPSMPDSVHIKSLNDWVLTGTSLKGAIRARAERIVNTLGKSPSIINELFGNVEDKKRSKNSIRGRLKVEESILSEFIAEQQSRIKIDRFTGGTIETALFDTMPIFAAINDKLKNNVVKINICIRDYKDMEVGLLLLILKDLWTGDLAVGGEKNIGRGVFKGKQAIIKLDDKQIVFDEDFNSLNNEHKTKLNDYVKALINHNEP